MRLRTAAFAAAAFAPPPAMAAGAPVSGPSLAAAGAVALVGLILLAVGLSRLAAGASVQGGSGPLAVLARFGGGGGAAGDGAMRRAVTSILAGVALLGLPDMFGVGVVSQMRAAYQQSVAAGPGAVAGADIVPRGPSRSYASGGGAGAGAGGSTSFPWLLILTVAGVALLAVLALRMAADGGKRGGGGGGGGGGRRDFSPVQMHGAADSDDLPLHPEEGYGGVEAAAAPSRSALEVLFGLIERLQKRIEILLKTAKEQLRRLADEKEEQKGRFRPLAAYAVQQAASLFRIIADRDDGGSGQPRAAETADPDSERENLNANAFAERIGQALSLTGADLVAQIAKALSLPRRRVESDLHRLGAAGAPGHWVRVGNVVSDHAWTLVERHDKAEDRRFDGVVRFDQVDWFATLAVAERPSNLGMAIQPAPNCHVHLVSVRDERAAAIADRARAGVRLPDGGSWTLADLPLERIARHFGGASDGRWEVDPAGPDVEILVFDLQPKRILIVSGADRLRRALSSDEDPVRALIHVRKGAALASLGVSIGDVVPPE